MKTVLTAALLGTVLAAAVFFAHALIPLLLVLLFFGLIRRAVFGPRWRYAGYGFGYGCGGPARHGPPAWAQRTPTVDGRDWQRPAGTDSVHDVRVN